MTAIGMALGGGALLIAAVMHLAAPVMLRPAGAIQTPADTGAQRATAMPQRATSLHVTRVGSRVIAKRPDAHATKRAAYALAARPTPRKARNPVPERAQARLRATLAPRARPQVAVSRIAVAEPREIGRASRHKTTTRTLPAPKSAVVTARSGTKIARVRQLEVARLASRRGARVAPTPEPPVGFDERPSLVEAPLAGGATASVSANDAGLSGLRIRGRLLATPAPVATAYASP